MAYAHAGLIAQSYAHGNLLSGHAIAAPILAAPAIHAAPAIIKAAPAIVKAAPVIDYFVSN